MYENTVYVSGRFFRHPLPTPLTLLLLYFYVQDRPNRDYMGAMRKTSKILYRNASQMMSPRDSPITTAELLYITRHGDAQMRIK